MSGPAAGRRLLRAFRLARDAGYRIDATRRRTAAALFARVLRQSYGAHVSFRAFEDFAAEQAPRWGAPQVLPIRLSIVVVSYKQPIALECLLASLACQVVQNFEVLVYHDGPDAATREVAERFARMSDRFRYRETDVRHDDWGHSLRAMGIADARGEFLLITNGDNYYVPRFTEFVFEAVETGGLDVVLWDLVHSYSSPGRKTLRCYTPFRVFPAKYMVDIAALIVRTALARRAGWRDRSHAGDASYVDDVLRLPDETIRVGKVEKTLAVHN